LPTPKTTKPKAFTFGFVAVGDRGLELLLDSSKESPILEETGAKSGAIDWVALRQPIQADACRNEQLAALIELWLKLPADVQASVASLLRSMIALLKAEGQER
jgi:hypothetical protein